MFESLSVRVLRAGIVMILLKDLEKIVCRLDVFSGLKIVSVKIIDS
jgi:hypothetical protein